MLKKDLNGIWKLLNDKREILCQVQVPGSVIAALYNEGSIGHPYYRMNEYDVKELFRKDYWFEREFILTKEELENDRVELVCEGLDTICHVFLNDTEIAYTTDMHRTYRIDLKAYAKEGANSLRVLCKSPLQYIDNYEYRKGKEIKYGTDCTTMGNQLIRKAHSMFGWDWGPELIDAGIWRDIYLEISSGPVIRDVRIRQYHQEDGSVLVDVELAVEALTEEAQKDAPYSLSLKVREDSLQEKQKKKNTGELLAPFLPEEKKLHYAPELETDGVRREFSWLQAQIRVEDPFLWWPNGYGDQPLYDLTVKTPDGERKSYTLGLRTLTVSREEDQWGEEFVFVVNGQKIFARGADYIPEDAVYPWITRGKIDYLLRSCVLANFNMIRVWGGGYFPADTFYELCDRYGLLVWQDLMFACNAYDLTEEFEKNIIAETYDNVRRIRHHACLAMWCGNNELEAAWVDWEDFKKETPYVRADYIKMFEDILPKAVRAVDDQTFFWPSSPSSGGCFDDPDDENRGDTHYWMVWHGLLPFTDYQNHYFRFCSEFGFQSFPCMKTVKRYTEAEDLNIFSPVMESHQKNNSANGKLLYYLAENFRYPKDLQSILYITQVLQGMAIKYGVEHWRRNRGRCMGALYWQLNDNWPVASWASIDYYGRWKPLHYLAKKFFAPAAISILKKEDNASVYVENETGKKLVGKAYLRVKDLYFHTVYECQQKFGIPAFTSDVAASIEFPAEFTGIGDVPMNREELFLTAEVVFEDGTVLRECETFVPFKKMLLPKSNIRCDVERKEEGYLLTLQSDTFAPFVELDFEDADVIFEDNYFTIQSEEPVKIYLADKDILKGNFQNAGDLEQRLKINTVAYTYA